MDKLSLYIHIPFCERKCFYCDFTSFPRKSENIEKYINYLIKELALYKKKLENYSIGTIFIGGGTPSSIDGHHIYRILEYINNNFNIDKESEITIEVNPGTLSLEKARAYKEIGINRISLGLQTMNDELLKSIGRIHTSKDFIDSYEILRKLGLNNINVDLMFGLPNQSLKDIKDTIDKVTELDIKHISYYSLILEEGTLLNDLYEEGKLDLPNEDDERQMYHKGIEYLKQKGYSQYEISNFSKEGYECKHNLIYWKVKPYLGIGISSHSNMEKKRFWNPNTLFGYYDKLDNGILPIEGEETIDREMEISEYIILSLRLINGINKDEFKKRFGIEINEMYNDIINKNKNNGLLQEDKEKICLTEKGLDLCNIVELDFYL